MPPSTRAPLSRAIHVLCEELHRAIKVLLRVLNMNFDHVVEVLSEELHRVVLVPSRILLLPPVRLERR
jgi:hypothetical protein